MSELERRVDAGPIVSSLSHVLLCFLHGVGVVRPVQGMQLSLRATRLRAHGGAVMTRAPVAETLVDHGRATRVGLADARGTGPGAVSSRLRPPHRR